MTTTPNPGGTMPDASVSEFERHLREIAEQSPGLSVRAAVMFAEAREAGNDDPLPDPNDARALALWATCQAEVMAYLPHNPINAIKELRAAGHTWGMNVSLLHAKNAIDHIRGGFPRTATQPQPTTTPRDGGEGL